MDYKYVFIVNGISTIGRPVFVMNRLNPFGSMGTHVWVVNGTSTIGEPVFVMNSLAPFGGPLGGEQVFVVNEEVLEWLNIQL
jgi:hypothetical protein